MALSTYAELQTAIADYLARSDLTSFIPDFIRLAEIRIQRETDLRLRFTEGFLADQAMVADQDYVDMPTDAVEMRWIFVQGNPGTRVDIVAPEIFYNVKEQDGGSKPKVAMQRGLQVALAPTPGDAHLYNAHFYKGIPPLTAQDPTNWLLTNAPDTLLYGSLIEASLFIQNDEAVMRWQALFDRARRTLDRQEGRARLGGGAVRTRPDTFA